MANKTNAQTEIFRSSFPAAQCSDPRQLGVLLNAYRPFLLSVATQHLPENLNAKLGASDVVQETFVRAAEKFSEFRGSSEPELRSWLLQIVQNCVADIRRRYSDGTKRAVSREIFSLNTEAGLSAALMRLTKSDAIHSREEGLGALRRAMMRLEPHEQEIIRLRSLQELPFGEVARQTNKRTTHAAIKIWCRAIQKLSEKLRQELRRNDGRSA